MNGFAAGYKTSGDEERRVATANFFNIITGTHSYATGGSNDGEYWGAPFQLGGTIAGVGFSLHVLGIVILASSDQIACPSGQNY